MSLLHQTLIINDVISHQVNQGDAFAHLFNAQHALYEACPELGPHYLQNRRELLTIIGTLLTCGRVSVFDLQSKTRMDIIWGVRHVVIENQATEEDIEVEEVEAAEPTEPTVEISEPIDPDEVLTILGAKDFSTWRFMTKEDLEATLDWPLVDEWRQPTDKAEYTVRTHPDGTPFCTRSKGDQQWRVPITDAIGYWMCWHPDSKTMKCPFAPEIPAEEVPAAEDDIPF